MSLNLPTQPDIDKAWAEEAERRVDQIDRGDVALIPGEKVFAKYMRHSHASVIIRAHGHPYQRTPGAVC